VSERVLRAPRLLARLVKLEHTVFALPFAYVGALLAWGDVPRARDLLWITIAMLGARTLAMALNRLIDAAVDARNPRTAGRERAGEPTPPMGWSLTKPELLFGSPVVPLIWDGTQRQARIGR
jgi:4-hydroxybenzoate polyprenyltransferase